MGELDPGEEVVLGRFGGRAEKISLKLGEIQDLFGITPAMKRAQKLSRREKTRARECRKRGRLSQDRREMLQTKHSWALSSREVVCSGARST